MSSQPLTAPETPTQPTWWQALGGQPALQPQVHGGRIRMPGARLKQEGSWTHGWLILLPVSLQFSSVIAAWAAVCGLAVGVWQAWRVRHAALDLAWREVGSGEPDAGQGVLVFQLDGGLQPAVRVKVAELASVHLTGSVNQRVLRLGLRNGHAVLQPLQAHFLRRPTDLESVVRAWLLGLQGERALPEPHAAPARLTPLFVAQTADALPEPALQSRGAAVPLVIEPAGAPLSKTGHWFKWRPSSGVFQQADGIHTR